MENFSKSVSKPANLQTVLIFEQRVERKL